MKKSYLLILLIVLIILGFVLNKDKSENFNITGETLSRRLGGLKEIIYYSSKETKTISFENSDFDIHGKPYWNNDRAEFFMPFGKKIEDRKCFDFKIGLFDLNGEILDTIYNHQPCKTLNYSRSPNGAYLLISSIEFTEWSQNREDEINIQYEIFDIKKERIVDSFKIISKPIFEINDENIWGKNSDKFIYSKRKKQPYYKTEDMQENYIYQLYEKKGNYLGKGRNYSFSPTKEDLVLYIKANNIWGKNLITQEEFMVYEAVDGERLTDFRWTPKGNCILINGGTHRKLLKILGDKFSWKPFSKLLNINSKEIKSKNRGYRIDTWK